MMAWNFNMDEAPRGRTERRTKKDAKGNLVEYDHFVPDKIIAAGTGGVVTTSRWLPNEQRWNMFTADTPPLAWQEWPEHPHGSSDA